MGFQEYNYDDEEQEVGLINKFAKKKVSKKSLKTLVEIVTKVDPAIRQIIHMKPIAGVEYNHSLIVIVDTEDMFCEYELLNKIILKLSDYELTTRVYNVNEALPIRVRTALIGDFCNCVYGQNFRQYTLTKDIIDFAIEEANTKVNQAKHSYLSRFKIQQFNTFGFDNPETNAIRGVTSAFGQLAESVKQIYGVYKDSTKNDKYEKMYKAIQYYCTIKYTGFNSIYILPELETAYESTEKLTSSFIIELTALLST